MTSFLNQLKTSNEEEDFSFAMQLTTSSVFPKVLRAAIELDLLEIMAKSGLGAQLSPTEIASQLPTKNTDAPKIIDRMLRLLASHSILTCKLVTDKDGQAQRLYGLAPVCKYLTRNEDGVSMAPLLLLHQDKFSDGFWYHLKDAVLEGGTPFHKAYGMPVFEYMATDARPHKLFNEAMYNTTIIGMKKILEVYKGFDGLKELVDVGGGFGANLSLIVSKYPQIKGINFDLPHVIKESSPCPGVEYVGGDMFSYVPKGEAIFMKWVLHNWSDDECLKLLKNCYDALPEFGKVIVLESIVPEFPDTSHESKNVFEVDLKMFNIFPGGKERTKVEFEALARQAGFTALKLICRVYNCWVIEFYKKGSPI